MAQGIAAVEVALDVVRHLAAEALGQFEVLLHQLVGALQRPLRPPQGGPQRQAHGDQQQGNQVGEQFQAHRNLGRQSARQVSALPVRAAARSWMGSGRWPDDIAVR
ncbi:hypothetical protein D9M68_977420 [compost metagenome]